MHTITNLKLALASLKAAINPPPNNDRERDGAIQRFEYTFELSWKSIRKYFVLIGLNLSVGPKVLLREAFREGLIHNLTPWFDFLQARNNLSHIYCGLIADEVFAQIPHFIIECDDLIYQLEKRIHDLER